MVSAHQIVSSFDSHADYVIVENPARFTTGYFIAPSFRDYLRNQRANHQDSADNPDNDRHP